MRAGELADRRERSGTVLRKRATERLGRRERAGVSDAIGIDRREVRLGLAQGEPERFDDEPALLAWIASTRRTPPAVR